MLRISTGAHFEATIPIRSQKATPQNKCGRGQPPRPHRSWFPDLPLSPLGGGMTASARQRSRPERATSAAFAEAGCRSARSRDRASATAATASDPFLFRRTVGEEAATPGQPVALVAPLSGGLRRFTLENRRLPLAQPQSFGSFRNAHVFAGDTFHELALHGNRKTFSPCAETVDVETSLWNNVEN